MPAITNANGTMGGVTSDRRIMTESINRDYGEAVAQDKGWAFSFCDTAVTPTGAADVFCRISNTSSDTLFITKVRAQAASAENIDIQLTANYTSATSHAAQAAVNKNAAYQGSNLWTAKGDFESDVDITGDSGSVTVARLSCETAATDREITFSPPLVVPGGYSLLLEAVTGAVALMYSVEGHLDVVAKADA